MFGRASPNVPLMIPLRASVSPWLKMMMASAPAASALSALVAKAQAPRWTSATSAGPRKRFGSKSDASQPDVDVRFGEIVGRDLDVLESDPALPRQAARR